MIMDFLMYINGEKRYNAVSSTKILVKSETMDAAGIESAIIETHAGMDYHNRNCDNSNCDT